MDKNGLFTLIHDLYIPDYVKHASHQLCVFSEPSNMDILIGALCASVGVILLSSVGIAIYVRRHCSRQEDDEDDDKDDTGSGPFVPGQYNGPFNHADRNLWQRSESMTSSNTPWPLYPGQALDPRVPYPGQPLRGRNDYSSRRSRSVTSSEPSYFTGRDPTDYPRNRRNSVESVESDSDYYGSRDNTLDGGDWVESATHRDQRNRHPAWSPDLGPAGPSLWESSPYRDQNHQAIIPEDIEMDIKDDESDVGYAHHIPTATGPSWYHRHPSSTGPVLPQTAFTLPKLMRQPSSEPSYVGVFMKNKKGDPSRDLSNNGTSSGVYSRQRSEESGRAYPGLPRHDELASSMSPEQEPSIVPTVSSGDSSLLNPGQAYPTPNPELGSDPALDLCNQADPDVSI